MVEIIFLMVEIFVVFFSTIEIIFSIIEIFVVFFFFLFEANFIQLVVLNLSHLNYIKLCLFLTSNER